MDEGSSYSLQQQPAPPLSRRHGGGYSVNYIQNQAQIEDSIACTDEVIQDDAVFKVPIGLPPNKFRRGM